MFNPITQYDQLVFTNIWGGKVGIDLHLPRPAFLLLANEFLVETAQPGRQDTVGYWLKGTDKVFQKVSEAQAFAHDLWLHFTYDKPIVFDALLQAAQDENLKVYDQITGCALIDALNTLNQPWVPEILEKYTHDEIIAYAAREAPDIISLVGLAP